MYNYRVAKAQFWPFAKACREFYMSTHPILKALASVDPCKTEYSDFAKSVDKLAPEWTIDLQLFDEGDSYLIRVLESGYFFMKNAAEWLSFGLEHVTYDDRCDVPPEDEPNKAVAVWCDERIDAREYLMYPLVSRDDMMWLYFND